MAQMVFPGNDLNQPMTKRKSMILNRLMIQLRVEQMSEIGLRYL